MTILSHDEEVKIIMVDNGELLTDRKNILEENKDKTVITLMPSSPSESGMKTFGDSVITTKEDEEELKITLNGTYDIMLGCLYKDCVLPEALRLSVKEALSYLLKSKVKPDIIYVMHSCFMTKKEFINMILILQGIIQELKIKASLMIEKVNYQGIDSLSMSYDDDNESPKKDKKKKKKDKKKNKF